MDNFILRTISYTKEDKPPRILNQFLGAHYELVKRENLNIVGWLNKLHAYYPDMKPDHAELYYGFIIYSDIMLLEKGKNNFVMTENGTTFEKIKQ